MADADQNLISNSTIYISNMSEDVWPFISQISNKGQYNYEVNENADLSDRDLLAYAGEDNVTIVLPRPVDPDFLKYYLSIFGNKNLKILVPPTHSGQISLDILDSPDLLNELRQTGNGSKRIMMTCYSSSPQFYKLVKRLRQLGLNVATPESPEEPDSWTPNFYGSKSGIRQLAQQSSAHEPDLKMAEGLIASGIYNVAKIAAMVYIKENGVVLKTDKGHSGAGMYIFRPGDLPTTYQACEETIIENLKKDNYWDKFPIVVEHLLSVSTTIGGGFPNVEFKIRKTGEVEFLYYCGMRVTKHGVFKGVEINDDVLSDKIATQIMDTGFFVGEQYAQYGYRGYFDVDFVATKSGDLYVTESNARRTGGTHVYLTAKALFDDDFMHATYTLSNNLHKLPNNSIKTFNELLNRLEPILFSRSKSEGVILATANLLKQSEIAYIIFGKNKKRALDVELKMEELLSK